MANHLFMTDAEVARALGVTTQGFKEQLELLERKEFPHEDEFFKNRRYWPAVKAYFDREYGLISTPAPTPYGPDGVENW